MKNKSEIVQAEIYRENLEKTLVGLHLRQTVALETIARALSNFTSYLDRIVNGNDGSLKIKLRDTK